MNLKRVVGIEAAKYVKDGIIVSLGTGSTTKFMVDEIGRCIKEEGLSIVGATTSKETEKQALALGVPLKSIDKVSYVGLTIDDADEIGADFQRIKDGGAALLFEKIVATCPKKCIWIVGKSKMMDDLEAFPFPIEVVLYGNCQLVYLFKEKGYYSAPRLNAAGGALITGEGYHIIDSCLEKITDPETLGSYLDNLVGVVEHDLFSNMVSIVIVGYEGRLETLHVLAR